MWPGCLCLQVPRQVLRKNQRSPCWSQHRDQIAQERKRVSYSHLLLREEVMNVSATPATADQISHGGNSGTTRQPLRWRLTRRLVPVFSFSSCAMFPPQQTFPCDKWKASLKKKKSGKNECGKVSLTRGDTLSPGLRLEEGGSPRRPLQPEFLTGPLDSWVVNNQL